MLLMVLSISTEDTWALYSSETVSGQNSLYGGSIELSVTPDDDNAPEEATFTPGSSFVYGMVVENDGRNTLRYRPRLIESEDNDLCGMLMLSARIGDTTFYDGPLLDFSYVPPALDEGDENVWQLLFTLPKDVSFEGAVTCEITFRFEAWQSHAFSLGMGWYDEVEIIVPQMTFDGEVSSEEQQSLDAQEEVIIVPLVPPVENEDPLKDQIQIDPAVSSEFEPSIEISENDPKEVEENPELKESEE